MSTESSGRAVGVHFAGDLQRTLIDAAVLELGDVGADRLSLRSVARRAGVSHAAPAHHFGGKTGLLTAVAAEAFARLHERLTASVADSTDPIDGLVELGTAYVDFAVAHPGEFELMFNPHLIDTGDSDYRRTSGASHAALRRQVEQLQSRGWRTGASLDDLTTATWALVHGLSTLRIRGALGTDDAGKVPAELVRVAAALIE